MTPTGNRRVRDGAVNRKRTRPGSTVAGPAVLLVVIAVAWTAAAALDPDLAIYEVIVEPSNPLPGSSVLLTAVVENLGRSDTPAPFFVRFEVDGETLGSVVIENLSPGQRESVTVSWIAEEGVHRIVVEVDRPFDRVVEEDESNNTARLDLLVSPSADVARRLSGLRIAVAPFEDQSASGYVNVGAGVADKLSDRLTGFGIRTTDREELEGIMQEAGLNPYLLSDVVTAAGMAGADLLLTGSVVGIGVAQSALTLGAVSFCGGSAEVTLSTDVVDVLTSAILFELSAEGHYKGSTELKLDLSGLLSPEDSLDVCLGGLRTDRDAYHGGESVSIGYRNGAADAWYSVEVYTSTGTFLRWLGWRYIAAGACGSWFWNQVDSFGERVAPSVYVAKLWDGASSIASTTFQIRPGGGLLPLHDEITVGSEPFEDSIVSGAINSAVDLLLSSLVLSLEEDAPQLAAAASRAESVGAAHSPALIEAQIAATLPDGRIAINVGTDYGVSKGDFFQVINPTDSSIRGEIVIVEVRDHVSYAVKTADFDVQVGDVVRWIQP